jgi:hypothetical protein
MAGVSSNLGHYRLMIHFFINAFDFTRRQSYILGMDVGAAPPESRLTRSRPGDD